jgi:hypothetical protein
LATVGIVVAMGGKKDGGTQTAGASNEPGSASGSIAAVVTPTPTPAPPVVQDAAQPAAPADAASVAVAPADAATETPQKDAPAGKTGEKRKGRLVVRAFPVLTVYVDNKKIHDTPVDMNLPVGKHKLRLVNAEVGKDESVNVTIEENKTETIERK